MIWLTLRVRRDFKTWERSTRIAFVLGIVLLVLALVAALLAPPEVRVPVLGGASALLLIIELTVLWGNRGMISAFTRAQRLYMVGDFAGTLALLEGMRTKADARALTLLGNTYRQLGRLDESEAVLSEAVGKAPNHYFPIYGFGRTLLSEGRYAEAVDAIQRAVELGAPSVVRGDLGEAYYRLGKRDDAVLALHDTVVNEPHRKLMAQYLLYRMGVGEPPTVDVVEAGLTYWQATAERFRATPYGIALESDVYEMQSRGIETHGEP
jgi:tetratricopeptide (TPR) repeat protein